MFVQKEYNRSLAVDYANTWAFRRNPRYLDFHGLGGDCTNFISQCVYAGCKVMNYTPVHGWYYISADNRTAAWTGVSYLYSFLTLNRGIGPYARNIPVEKIKVADIIQLGHDNGDYYHSLIVVETGEIPSVDNILIATHSFDANRRPLNTYRYQKIRFLHIEGVRENK